MASRKKYRQKYLNLHRRYEAWAYKKLRKFFREWPKDLVLIGPPESWKAQIDSQLDIGDLIELYVEIYTVIGLKHGERIGRDIDDMSKAFNLNRFKDNHRWDVIKYLQDQGLKRIISIKRTYVEHLRDLIATDYDLDLSIGEIRRIVRSIVGHRNFYQWQAARIARTESTAASNFGAIKSAKTFGFRVVKEWISGQDARVRRKPLSRFDHLAMDGVQVPQEQPFIFNDGEDAIQFPGDPTGEPGNIINCRCAVAMVPARDKDGNLIRM